MESPSRKEMMSRMDFFIGVWAIEVFHPQLQPVPVTGETSFEWLDGHYSSSARRSASLDFQAA